MPWHQLTVTTTEQSAPKVAKHFTHLGAVSVTYMDAEDEPVYEPRIGETKIWTNTQVEALFELDIEPEDVKAAMNKKFKTIGNSWQYQFIEDQAWERAWMEFYHPMKFANRLWVCPTDQEQYEEGTVCLTLDPGLAFGTGTHPTTALCLEWLASNDLTGKTVIDYGCGSGILAVAAILLGAKVAYAVDIDPQALTATRDNALKNNVVDKIHCYLPEDFTPFQADVVLANILAKPLIDLSTSISALVIEKGALILSGILAEQADSVILAYSEQIDFAPRVQQEDWIRLNGHKR